jgi:hypothetical protein
MTVLPMLARQCHPPAPRPRWSRDDLFKIRQALDAARAPFRIDDAPSEACGVVRVDHLYTRATGDAVDRGRFSEA